MKNATAQKKRARTRREPLSATEAIRLLERRARLRPKKPSPDTFSCFRTERAGATSGPKARRRWSSGWHHNLTTDTASGFTNRRDWQSKLMGGGFAESSVFAGVAKTGTPPTATLFTINTGTLPTAGQGLAGGQLWAFPASGGAGVYGNIQSNTTTAFTVDGWHDPTTGASGAATPGAGANYAVGQGQAPARYLALSTDAGAPTSADTTMTGEITTSDLSRAIGTYAHTAAATTYSLQHVFNATTTATINKECNAGGANTTSPGVMPFESAEPTPPALISGDQLTQTETITIN